jgi:hypothetical protein
MAQINEELIRQVFQEMLKYRPTLQKYTMLDEEDEDEEVDFRILGDQIIKNFPWPFGVELRRLFSASMRDLSRMRLDQIFKTIERTMQFVSFVMLSQLSQDVLLKKVQVPENISRDIENRLMVLSMGNFTWLIRAVQQERRGVVHA